MTASKRTPEQQDRAEVRYLRSLRPHTVLEMFVEQEGVIWRKITNRAGIDEDTRVEVDKALDWLAVGIERDLLYSIDRGPYEDDPAYLIATGLRKASAGEADVYVASKCVVEANTAKAQAEADEATIKRLRKERPELFS